MPKFKFSKTIQYTEVVEVEAADLASAKVLALEVDGETQNDEVVYEMKLLSQAGPDHA